MERNKKHLAGILALFAITVFTVAFASGQITTQETGPTAINITTDAVTNVKETEATFQATLTGFDNTDYDAALIFWNYSTDSALDQPGPMTVENSEIQRSVFHPDLAPDTSYNVEAYAEPLVWDDPTLMDNYQKKLATSSYIGEYPSSFQPDLSQTYSQTSNSSSEFYTSKGIAFSSDGLKAIVSGEASYSDAVYSYNLSNPWDVSSTSITQTSSGLYESMSGPEYNGVDVSPGGKRMVIVNNSEGVETYNLSSPFEVNSPTMTSSVSLKEYNGFADVEMSPDGTSLYLLKYEEVLAFELSEPWDVSTATYSASKNVGYDYDEGIWIAPGGGKMVTSDSGGEIAEFDLSTPWDITSASQTNTINKRYGYGLAMSHDGDVLAVTDEYGDATVYER